MVIGVNIRFLQSGQGGYASFIRRVVESISRSHSAHEFYFLSDKHFDETSGFPSNLHTVIVGRQPNNLLRNYWLRRILRTVLKKIDADLLITADGSYSSNARLPQIIFVSEENLIDAGSTTKSRRLVKKLAALVNKRGVLMVASVHTKKLLIENLGVPESKIAVIYPTAADIFRPAVQEVQSEVKVQHTQGNEFFLFVGDLDSKDNLVNLLKAFSIFKKRQQSTMKLILASENIITNSTIPGLVSTYKYKDEIVILTGLTEYELSRLIAGSYAVINPLPDLGIQVLRAMQMEIPLIAASHPATREVAGDAALYFNAADHSDLAENLMLLYKDEEVRNRLIENGKNIQANFTMERMASLFWQLIEKICAARD